MAPTLCVFLWLCFLLRGSFYCAFLPLWEGYDEWAHFAVVSNMAAGGRPLIARSEPVSREVAESLQLAPLPWSLRHYPPPCVTHDAYWQLSPGEREQRAVRLLALPVAWAGQPSATGPRAYESLQPPLYYWIAAPFTRLLYSRPLVDRVLLLRFLSLLIASLIVPLAFLTARDCFHRDLPALGVAALVVCMPELLIDVCRVGNECLGVVLYSALLCVFLRSLAAPPRLRTAILIGLLLGAGLLTKAYFLTALPAAALVWTVQFWRRPATRHAILRHAALAVALALGTSGWWYLRNLFTTGTWSGLEESVLLGRESWLHLLARIPQVDWRNAIDSILLSHVWFGAWSSLQVRSWIYHFFFAAGTLGALGLLRPSTTQTRTLTAFYLFFWAGQLYNVLLLFASKGASTSMGWYMYAVVLAELILVFTGLGLRRRWVLPAAIFSFSALDLYTVHFLSIPYYTGLIRHKPAGALAAFHLDQLQTTPPAEILSRLLANKPAFLTPEILCLLWILFLAATLAPLLAWCLLDREKQLFGDHPYRAAVPVPSIDFASHRFSALSARR